MPRRDATGGVMNIRVVGRIATIAAELYNKGRRSGLKGPDIFGVLTSHGRYAKKESAKAMELDGFEVKTTPAGDYWVSDHSKLLSEKRKKKSSDTQG